MMTIENIRAFLRQKCHILRTRLGPKGEQVAAWLSFSFERTAIVSVLGLGAILAIVILSMDKGSSGDGEEAHGEHGAASGEEENHGDHDKHGSSAGSQEHASEGEHGEGEGHKEQDSEHREQNDGEHGGHDEEHEGSEVELSDEAVAKSGIKIETANQSLIQRKLRLSGRVVPNRDRYTVIRPRFAGVIKRVAKDLGDKVNRGDVLAIVESNAARAPFEVRTGISGVIIDRQAIAGAYAPESEAMFKIADLSSVWVEVNVPDRDFNAVKVGLPIKVRDTFTNAEASVTVSYVSPVVHEDTQSLLLRAEIPNPNGQWKAGSFVDAEITLDETNVPVAVKAEAIHNIEGKNLVFVRDGKHFLAKPVTLGRIGRELVEITSGIAAGEGYATANSFIVKAELLKASAGHEH